MARPNYRLQGNQKVYILPLGDLHIGSDQFNLPYFEYCLDKIDEIQSEKRIYLMGDLIESASKNVGKSAFDSVMAVEEQVDTVINYLKPFRKDIVYACIGNHEQRMIKDFNNNSIHYIAKGLKCRYGHQHIDTFYINGELIRVYIAHGKGSAKYHYTAESKIIRDTQTIDADIIIQGHNHRCGHFSIPMKTHDWMRRKHYAFSGAFLKYNGYADEMLLPILPEAFVQMSINKNLRVRSNEFYIDECRPDLLEL